MTRQTVRHQVSLSAWGWFTTLGTCWALGPLMSDRRYLVTAAALLAVVVATGALLRLTRVPRLAVLGAQLVVAIELVVLRFTESWVLTPDAYETLVARFARFSDYAQQYAAPLPRDADATMAFALIVLGVGMLVDFIGVTMRRVPVLGLLFLLVYMVPVAHLGGEVSVLSFLPGAVGFVFMLAADESERLTHWGRQIRTVNAVWQHEAEVDETGLRRSRLRIGFGAVAIAAVLPLLLPSIDPRILFDGGSNGEGPGRGDGSVRVDDPSLDMRRNLATASNDVLVRVSGDDEPTYFRLAALDEFTGDVWRVGEREERDAISTDDRLPTPPRGGAVAEEAGVFDVELTDALDTSWLPTPYAPRSVRAETPWLVDPANLDVRAGSATDADEATYRLTTAVPMPSLLELRNSNLSASDRDRMRQFLELPDDMPQLFEETLTTATAGVQENDHALLALALQEWFRSRGGYTYSLEQVVDDQNRTGLAAVESFLEDRVGYCEQYASAMALMARRLGIPARVVVGFLRAEPGPDQTWEFRGQDMHSWPELYFEEVGWVRFEPTPPSVSGEAPTFEQNNAPSASATTEGTGAASRPTRTAPGENVAEDEAAAAGDTGGTTWRLVLLTLSGIVLLALLLAAPRLLREARTRRRWRRAVTPRAAAETAWTELRDGAVDLRLAWSDGDTPRNSGRRVREHLGDRATPDIVSALNALVIAIEQSRYARSLGVRTDLPAAVHSVRSALAAGRSRSTQRLARWLPASLWQTADPWPRRARGAGARHESVLTLGDLSRGAAAPRTPGR
jgi:transglutaminase-like putative cysteine protease